MLVSTHARGHPRAPMIVSALVVAIVLCSGAPALAVTGACNLSPAAVNGTAWTASAGTILCGGTFLPMSFRIPAGITVSVVNGAAVVIQSATWIEIAGAINADGAGGQGGTACTNNNSTGGNGSGSGGGPGGPANNIAGGGGGGGGGGFGCPSGHCGGTGGTGDDQNVHASGGNAYDTSNSYALPQPTGSGGGGGACSDTLGTYNNYGGSGGNGGGSLVLLAPQIQIDAGGLVSAVGLTGTGGKGGGSGGGGSGGDILLEAFQVWSNSGTITVAGGSGAAGTVGPSPDVGGGGGGGSGGRLKISAATTCSTGGTMSVAGAAGGSGASSGIITSTAGGNGLSGTMSCGLFDMYTSLAPSASASMVPAGSNVTISANPTNPEGYLLLYQYDCTGTGSSYSTPTSSATATCSWTTLGSHTIAVKATAYNTVTLLNGAQPGSLALFSLPQATTTVTVTDVPSVSVSAPQTGSVGTLVMPLQGTITDPAGQSPYTWSWDFGDGSTRSVSASATTNVQSHLYDVPKSYTVTLTVTDAHGASATGTASISIADENPAVTIGPLPAPINAGVAATFSAMASSVSSAANTAGFIFTFDWGDGLMSTVPATAHNGAGVVTTHAYANPGTYVLAVSARDEFGGTAGQSEAVTVLNPIPEVQVGATSTTVPVGSPLQASATATSAYASSFSFLFDWGDGETTTLTGTGLQTPTHYYEVPGSYTIHVTATDASGASGSGALNIMVSEVVPTVVIGTPSPSPLVANQPSMFSATATSPSTVATSTGFTYTFSWGDGSADTSVTGPQPGGTAATAHAYTTPGLYTLLVSATDAFGGTGAATTVVAVPDAPPTAALDATSYSGMAGTPVPITAIASSPSSTQQGAPFTYTFNWGDGQTTTLTGNTSVSTTHVWDAGGSYTITLTVSDSLTATSPPVSASANISNVAPVITRWTHPDGTTAAPTPFSVQVTDASHADTSAGFTVSWNFGDGAPPQSGLNLTSITHLFTAPGTNTVTVTVTDENGLKATASATITIRDAPPAVSLGPAQMVPRRTPVTLSPQLTPDIPTWMYTYAWTLGDGSTASTSSVTESFAAIGSYSVSVIVTDPYGGSASSSVDINVIDRLPVVSNALISPADPIALQALSLGYTYSDPDGDPENGTTIVWYVNGQGNATYNNQTSIPAADVQRNQSWYAVITPRDGIAFGASVTTNTVVVTDPPPSAQSLTITPPQPTHADTLRVSYTYAGIYPEQGTTIAWTRNGTIQNALANQVTVPPPLIRGDTWVVTVTPSDGTVSGNPVTATAVIQDTAPVLNSLPSITLNATGIHTTPASWTVSATDVDGDALTYDCSFPGTDLGPGPSFTEAFPIGTTLVTCTASDGTLTATTTFHVTVNDVPPTITVGADQTVPPGAVTVTAAGQDAFGRTLTYAWTAVSGPSIAQPGVGTTASYSFATFTAGTYVLRCTVSNGMGQASAETAVTVSQLAPVANPGASLRLMLAGETITLDGSHSVDPNEGNLSYSWTIVSGPAKLSSGTDPVTQLTATGGGQAVVSLNVDDGVRSAAGTVLVDIWALTAPAGPIASAGQNQTVFAGSTVTLDGSGSFAPNARELSYLWTWQSGPTVVLSDTASPQPTFAASTPGTDVFLLTVSDGTGSSQAQVNVTVLESENAAAPTAVISPADVTIQAGSLTNLDGSGSLSGTGQPLTLQWTWMSGPYVDITGTDQSRCALIAYGTGEAIMQLVASDGVHSSLPAFARLHVTAGPMTAPSVSASGPASAASDTAVSLHGSGADPNGLPLTYQWTQVSGPPVPIHAAETADAAFVPKLTGTYVFQLDVSDWIFSTSSMATVTVGDGDLPTAVALGPPSSARGGLVTLNGAASHDPMGHPLTFNWKQLSGPHVGLARADTVTPSFEASASGTYVFQLTVSNGTLTSAPASVTIGVSDGCTQAAQAGWVALLITGWLRRRRRG
jgi:PKD repeat protein